jgi:hypothetical protein
MASNVVSVLNRQLGIQWYYCYPQAVMVLSGGTIEIYIGNSISCESTMKSIREGQAREVRSNGRHEGHVCFSQDRHSRSRWENAMSRKVEHEACGGSGPSMQL